MKKKKTEKMKDFTAADGYRTAVQWIRLKVVSNI